MRMIFTVFRVIISIVLLPVCVAVTMSFYKGIFAIKSVSDSGLIFILGAFLYSLLHLLLFKLDFLYILGHELMHVIATLFSGGKAKDMKVSNKEGSVKTTTPNFLVVIAPYLIPGYTVLIAVLYFIVSFFTDVTKYYSIFIFLIGFTLMMHLSYTAQSVREKQSDLIRSGYVFSVSFLYVVNLIIVFLILSFVFKEISFFEFLSSSYEKSKGFYYFFWKQLFL